MKKEEDKKSKKEKTIKSYSLEKLKIMLEEAISDEDYEKASKLRDEINSRKNNKWKRYTSVY